MRRVIGALIVVVVVGGSQWFPPRDTVNDARVPSPARAPTAAGPAALPTSPADSSARRAPAAGRGVPDSFRRDPLAFLSRAPADSLDLLPGVGPVLANRIIDARRGQGSFTSWDDVLGVRGIGPVTIDKWKALAEARRGPAAR